MYDLTLPILDLFFRMGHLLSKPICLIVIIARLSVFILNCSCILQSDRFTGACHDVIVLLFAMTILRIRDSTVDKAENVLILCLTVVLHDLIEGRIVDFAFFKWWVMTVVVDIPHIDLAATIVVVPPELWPLVLLDEERHTVGWLVPVVVEKAVDDLEEVEQTVGLSLVGALDAESLLEILVSEEGQVELWIGLKSANQVPDWFHGLLLALRTSVLEELLETEEWVELLLVRRDEVPRQVFLILVNLIVIIVSQLDIIWTWK